METKDLMLGDWVNYIGAYKDDSGKIVKLWESPVPIKVTFITPDAVQYEDEEGCYECLDYELHPIPLAPEILEKNFEKKTFFGLYDDYFDLDIREYSDGIYIVTYHSCEMNIPDQTVHVSWVHELQHFLNHCGIEHKIKL